MPSDVDKPEPRLSVIIPTYHRESELAKTLAALARQTLDSALYEIIVADNGPSARTRELVAASTSDPSAPRTVYIEVPRPGPAAARNAAAEAARSSVLLLLGDDTEPASQDLLSRHHDWHCETDESRGLLGRITWTPFKTVSRFMAWLEEGGPQFNFHSLEEGDVDARLYFYSSHLSLKKSMFTEVGGFDERFPYAAIEDTDLGTRLIEQGFTLYYDPALLVYHDHPTTLEQSLERAGRVGRSAAIYNRDPGKTPHPAIRPARGLKWAAMCRLAPLAPLLAKASLPSPLQEHVWLLLHRAQYARGYNIEMGAPVGK